MKSYEYILQMLYDTMTLKYFLTFRRKLTVNPFGCLFVYCLFDVQNRKEECGYFEIKLIEVVNESNIIGPNYDIIYFA